MIKAVIYDMDGVIIDSEPLWREALIHCFNQVGFDFKDGAVVDDGHLSCP